MMNEPRSEIVLHLTKDEVKQFRWMMKARGVRRGREMLESIVKFSKRLFCCDGFRIFSIPMPQFNQPQFEIEKALFTPLTQTNSIMVVEQRDGNISDVAKMIPCAENQMIAFAVNPKYLAEALVQGQAMNTVRVFGKDGKPNLVTVEGCTGEVAYVMPMLPGSTETTLEPFAPKVVDVIETPKAES